MMISEFIDALQRCDQRAEIQIPEVACSASDIDPRDIINVPPGYVRGEQSGGVSYFVCRFITEGI